MKLLPRTKGEWVGVILVFVLLAALLLAVAFSETVNDTHFRALGQRIGEADHITVRARSNGEPEFTIPAEDTARFVRAVASARRWRTVPRGYDVPPYCFTFTFFARTNLLGMIHGNDEFLEFNGRRYHDDSLVMGQIIGTYWRPTPKQSARSVEEPK